jgi:hypothetical protein
VQKQDFKLPFVTALKSYKNMAANSHSFMMFTLSSLTNVYAESTSRSRCTNRINRKKFI